jgi:hypothetical protein
MKFYLYQECGYRNHAVPIPGVATMAEAVARAMVVGWDEDGEAAWLTDPESERAWVFAVAEEAAIDVEEFRDLYREARDAEKSAKQEREERQLYERLRRKYG